MTLAGDLAPLLEKWCCSDCIKLCTPRYVLFVTYKKDSERRAKRRRELKIGVSAHTYSQQVCEQLLRKAARSKQAAASIFMTLEPCPVEILKGIHLNIASMVPREGQVHLTEVVQTHGMRGGGKIRWEFKLLTTVAVDTLFLRGIHHTLRVSGTLRQGPAYIRSDTKAAFAIVPPVEFVLTATAPIYACVPKLKVSADTICLPTDGVFRFNNSIEYDDQSQIAFKIFLATLLHRMPAPWLSTHLSQAQRHQVQGLARHAGASSRADQQ
eukprot:6181926-Pleurochrysis_carterae.AAC.1